MTNGGVRIHYEDDGTGPAVIMRTGAGGDCRIWRDAGYVAGLPGYRKILVDQRGRGKSDRPPTIAEHTYELHVSDIAAVLDNEGIEAAAFVGYSAGAALGVAFGSLHLDRLKALVGIGSLPCINFADRPRPPDMEAEIRRIVDAGGVRAEYFAFARQDNDRFPDPIHENVVGGDPMMRALDAVASYSSTWRGPLDAYPKLKAPVLIVAGEKEDPEMETERSIAKIPNGKLVRLPGIGHLSAFYRSDLTLPYIGPFLKEHLG